jgi:programmed cell death protein 4
MVEFAKRPEVTVSTMGKLNNPSGEGVPLKSISVSSEKNGPQRNHYQHTEKDLETKVKEEGSSKRNITRKKSDGGNFDSKNKKQGGAGKGKWSNAAEAIYADELPDITKDDPLYDDEDVNSSYVLSSAAAAEGPSGFDPVAERTVFGPMLTLPEFKIRVTESLREYFDSGDAGEFILNIQEMKCMEYHVELVKRAVSLSCDEGPRERELTSRLLTCIHPSLLSDEDMEAGFDQVLESMDDLEIDIPDAKGMVGSFLARAVVDEVLPPAFVSSKSFPEDSVLDIAVKLLSREHCTARLEKVWGPGDGRPVEELKVVMDQLLKEYLLSRELDEAARCVRELNAPHFHHELVKRGVKIAMEEDGANKGASTHSDPSIDAMAALFEFLVGNAIVSEFQVSKGLIKLHKILDDLKLDVPGAGDMLKEFEEMIKERGCLPK